MGSEPVFEFYGCGGRGKKAKSERTSGAEQQLWREERKDDGHVLCAPLSKDHALSRVFGKQGGRCSVELDCKYVRELLKEKWANGDR